MHKLLQASPVVLVSFAAIALAACGSSSTGTGAGTSSPATSAPTTAPTTAPTATPGPVSVNCPSAADVNSGLGVNVGAPKQTPTTGNPPGDSGVSCEYTSASLNDIVILTLGTGPVKVNFIATVEAGEQKAASQQGVKYKVTSVSGVGDQADYVTFSRAGGYTEDGILAESSNAGVIITVIPPAPELGLESFASQLLG